MSKNIGRFEPTPSRTPEECERHYTTAHIPMAQNLLRPTSWLRSYHVNRAVAQADVGGGFNQRPRAWRFVILRFPEGASIAFAPEDIEMICRDHVNCLYRLRQCDVEEHVAFDSLSGEHLALSKFLIEAERAPGVAPEDGRAAFQRLTAAVQETMREAFGARRLVVNAILNEALTEPVDVEGQRPVGIVETSTRAGYLECYFDHSRWGREALGPFGAAAVARDPAFAEVNVLEVEERAPLVLAN